MNPDITYENLRNDRQFPPNLETNYARPFDRLDEDATYACPSQQYSVPYVEKDVNQLYAKPIPKNQRQKPKQELYTEVLPKSLCNKNNPTYAELEFSSGSKKKKEKPEEPLYSEVQKQEYMNLNAKQNPNYGNICNDQFANADTSEYVEPAYCEIGKKY